MRFVRKPMVLAVLALSGLLTAAFAGPHSNNKNAASGNSYYLYTKALQVTDSGVALVPERFKWSVETSWSGVDVQGNNLPDTRVMLRLYDPAHNFTAVTAQLDLATAQKLHNELGNIIMKKLQNPNFQHRPQLYESKDIPTKRIAGIDANGTVIVEDVQPAK
ncbi:MAG: hypothetical protein ACI9HK_005307 [Pirellulaceae bacterium]|jgi:hypothetical protein